MRLPQRLSDHRSRRLPFRPNSSVELRPSATIAFALPTPRAANRNGDLPLVRRRGRHTVRPERSSCRRSRRGQSTGAQKKVRSSGAVANRPRHAWQSTATPKAAQISHIRASPNRPSRSTSTPTETLSTESRLTADRFGTGSSPGSRSTSLASARIVVVQGATSARRSRGIAASRERTTTGRLPISGNSHHHSSPRAGVWLMRRRQPGKTTPSRPTHRARRSGNGHRRRNWRRSRWRDAGQARPPALHRRALHHSIRIAAA